MALIIQSFPVHLWRSCWFTGEKVALSLHLRVPVFISFIDDSSLQQRSLLKIKTDTWDVTRNTCCFAVSQSYWPVLDRGRKTLWWKQRMSLSYRDGQSWLDRSVVDYTFQPTLFPAKRFLVFVVILLRTKLPSPLCRLKAPFQLKR